MMNLLDQIILLVTGLIALYLLWRFYNHYRSYRAGFDIPFMIAFTVLLVAGLLLIFLTYAVLENPLVIIVAALIPLALSYGLVRQFVPQYAKSYLIFAVIGFLALAITRLAMPGLPATLVLIIVHTVAGLTIFLLPFWAVNQKLAPPGFVGVGIGGALIGIGGIALAFLKTGSQLLFFNTAVVFAILAPLLLLMTLAFAWGFVTKMQHAT